MGSRILNVGVKSFSSPSQEEKKSPAGDKDEEGLPLLLSPEEVKPY